MSQLDAIALSEAVKRRLVDFALDDNFVRDPMVTEICRTIWSGIPEMGGLLSDLWIEGAFPAERSSESLESLAKQGRFNSELCDQLDRPDVVPKKRELYAHQYEAIIKAQTIHPNNDKPALIITAGTGAGKTESFLLPILHDLFQNHQNAGNGVKCIILYPMNALVNDQVERLYNWLQGQKKVTLFHFTSETPEDKERANSEGVHLWDACRMLTRWEARGLETRDGHKIDLDNSPRGPVPDMIITNYSMLEYMLCRPQDAVFFSKGLRAIVLDEAHLYTGTLAAEITLLLRRLLERCGLTSEQILQIATSATIGTGISGELETFAATLFTKSPSLVEIIQGQAERISYLDPQPPAAKPTPTEIAQQSWLDCSTIELNAQGTAHFTVNSEACQTLTKNLSLLVDVDVVKVAARQSEDKPAVLLHKALAPSSLLQQIEDILWKRKRLSLRELTEQIWGIDNKEAIRSTISLLQMGASARQNIGDYPLLPHRIHLLARPTDGLVVCLNTACTGNDTLKLDGLGCISAGFHDHCTYCQSATLSLYRCANCGEWVLAGIYDNMKTYLRPIPFTIMHLQSKSSEWLSKSICHMICDSTRGLNAEQITLDVATGRCTSSNANKRTLYKITNCPHCKTEEREEWKPFASFASLTLSILAESVLAELPEYPAGHNLWLPARGRRMLTFSDSRQGAARLGPRLSHQHETQLVRTAIVECLAKYPVADIEVIQDSQNEIEKLERQLAQDNLSPPSRQRKIIRLKEVRQELTEDLVGGTLEKWMERITNVTNLGELLDYETSFLHNAEKWSKKTQYEWDQNFERVKTRIKPLLAREFARPTRKQVSLETVGLAEVTYPNIDTLKAPGELLGLLSTTITRERLRNYWVLFLAALCDTLRSDGVVTLGSEKEDKDYQFSNLIGHWCAEKESDNYLVRFTGATGRQQRRKFAAEILRKCGMSDVDLDYYTVELLDAAFHQLQDQAERKTLPWLKTEPKQSKNGPASAIQIIFTQLGLRRPGSLYRCPITGHIWPREVLGCAPESDCVNLELVDDDILDKDSRIMRQRREFTDPKIKVFHMGLWAKEHSAQLSPN